MKNILVVIDMQNDFITGSLGTKEAEDIVKNIVDKISEYEHIYATRDTHYANYLDTNEGKNLPVLHCIKGSEGWQIQKDVAKALGNCTIIDKPSFGSIELAEALLEESKKDDIKILLVGLCTDICVVSNALMLKAYMPEVEVSVSKSCCAGVTNDSHNAALQTMQMCQINIVE